MVTNTTGDVASLYTKIAGIIAGRQTGDFILIVGHVHADFPAQVLLLDGHYVQGHLDTLVLHVADVHQQVVSQVGTRSHGNLVQQVVGNALVNVDATIDTVSQEAEVQTHVIGRGLFPLDIGIVALSGDGNDDVVAEHVIRTALIGVVGSD